MIRRSVCERLKSSTRKSRMALTCGPAGRRQAVLCSSIVSSIVVREGVAKRVLTGIKPTGSPHVGNLLGAIRPALQLADQGLEAMYFIADYHALISEKDTGKLASYTREVAATWLACGLDP